MSKAAGSHSVESEQAYWTAYFKQHGLRYCRGHEEPLDYWLAYFRQYGSQVLRQPGHDVSDEPRDDSGQWTSGGGGDGAGQLDPKVVEVGGDEWNKATARRLEREYQQARPAIDKTARDAVGKEVEEPTDEDEEEDDAPFVPEEWDQLTNDQQEDAKAQFLSKDLDSYFQSEVESWHDSGSAKEDATNKVVEDFNNGDEVDWVDDAITAFRNEFPDRIPYTNEQLMDAIDMGSLGGFAMNWLDEKLKEPSTLASVPPEEQQPLPGMEGPSTDPSQQLTQKMRDGLEEAIGKAFDEEVDKVAGDLDPPDYLHDSAKEMAEEDWDHGMDDESKFNWTKHYTSIIDDATETGSSTDQQSGGYFKIDALPKTYDPLNDTSGQDYQRTQALARYLSVQRAAQVLKDRDLLPSQQEFNEIGASNIISVKDNPAALQRELARIDSRLWSDWKTSSTSHNGKLLQLATADELGGRLRQEQITSAADELKADANRQYQEIGGYKGIKAYVRAKWEVTQYLLDKAGVKELELYRGVAFPKDVLEKGLKQFVTNVGSRKLLPNMHVERNGAASTTTDPGVANGWSRDDTRVVLRALVPRTAAVSVPAYGINIHSEHEVVIAGTAWKGWDAWRGDAPRFGHVPLQQAA